ncbi:tetratricopeptide repeat protein [Swingsia samuiensis]|uniref:Glycosyltransferase family 41 protein n=1 Tax=Swingsia samuiensis TaxID=1293412 RepID=A0A4Y6UMR9_9PROT|nr:tetratricopeptide repeat-containing glycosyltransferase family protein [Swingsia samuiensis]QDH17681.1 glycosyltransferase family 41 protein [Swingsia samuiensis]
MLAHHNTEPLSTPTDHELNKIQTLIKQGNASQALETLKNFKNSPAVHLMRSRAFFQLNQYSDTAQELNNASPPVGGHAITTFIDEAVLQRRRPDILHVLSEAQKLTPRDPRLLDAQGLVLMHLGRFQEAEIALKKSLGIRPNNLETLNFLAMVLSEAGRFDEALSIMQYLRTASPEEWGPGCNMACILNNIGRLEEAANVYRETIPLAPHEPVLRLNHSITMLKSGRMAQGWTEHEWRFGVPGHTSLPKATLLPNITPNLNLKGKRVLVTQEEGLGDTLMYLRYIPLLGRTGAIVHIWGTSTLADLCQRMEGVSVVQHGGETPEYDYHCPFISLPRVFSATQTPMGVPVPYLIPSPDKVAQWKKILRPDRQLRVGLVWAGGARPEHTNAYMLDRQRSMPLALLAPLAKLKGITFYSLQKDEPASQISDFPSPLIDYMPQCLDMDDTAALVSCLDIIVSVDTSMVHLAGGLGKPVIMMDRFNNCWRWQQGREDSPWYPFMRIVRQTHFRDWSDVISQVKDLLQEAAAQH